MEKSGVLAAFCLEGQSAKRYDVNSITTPLIMPRTLKVLLNWLACASLGVSLVAAVIAYPPLFFAIALMGPVLLLFAVGLAIAGEGNRLGWGLGFFVLCGLLSTVAPRLLPASGTHGVVGGVVLFGAIPIVPALILWSAHAFGNWRGRAQRMPVDKHL